jgi:hypothetical protein
MPSKDGVGTDQSDDAREERASQGMTTHREAAALAVREPEPALPEHFSQDSILFTRVVQGSLLVPVEPAGEGQDKELGGEGERFRGGSRLPQRQRKCWRGGVFERLHHTGAFLPPALPPSNAKSLRYTRHGRKDRGSRVSS